VIQISCPCSLNLGFGGSNQCVAVLCQIVRIDRYRFQKQPGCLSESGSGLIQMLPAQTIPAALMIHFLCCLPRRLDLSARHAAPVNRSKRVFAGRATILSSADKEEQKPFEPGGFHEQKFL